MPEERVQKILARAGYGSRRASEDLITAGRVKINGKVAVLGSKADPQKDTVTIDNQPIAREQAPVYIALNKPTGVLSEVSPEEPRQTVRDLVPVPGHLFIVGRLDLESEGLILLTNDGEMANKLTHPRYGHEKEYRVLVGARPDERQMEAWRHGVVLEDGYRTAPAQMRLEGIAGKGAWLRVILREGRKRQIREMGKQTGLPVLRIQRVRIGSLLLGDLRLGEWRHLRPDEVRALRMAKTTRDAGHQSLRMRKSMPRREPRSDERRETPRGAGRPPRGEERRESPRGAARPPRGITHREPPGGEDRPPRGETRRPLRDTPPGGSRPARDETRRPTRETPSGSSRPGRGGPGRPSRPPNESPSGTARPPRRSPRPPRDDRSRGPRGRNS